MAYQDDLYDKLDEQTKDIVKAMPDFASKFFRKIKSKGMSPRTRLQYAYDLKRFFDFLENSAGFKNENMKTMTAEEVLGRLNNDDIQEYLDTLEYYEVRTKDGQTRKKRSSEAMKARRISSLRSFYKYYFKTGEITNNLADLMELPKMHDKAIVVMERSEVARMLAAVTDTTGMSEGDIKRHKKIEKRDVAIITLLLGTGIRVSELVGIDLLDIDYYESSILVTRKGGDQDEVYFGEEVESALLEYQEECRESLLGEDKKERAFFLSMHHKRLSVAMVEKMVKGYAEKAGLNMKVTPHSCRKSFGTAIYNQTGDIYLVADALHHSSVETTKRHYAKVNPEHKRIAAKEASSLLSDD